VCDQLSAVTSNLGTAYALATNSGYSRGAQMTSIVLSSKKIVSLGIFYLPDDLYWDYDVPMTYIPHTKSFITLAYEQVGVNQYQYWVINATLLGNNGKWVVTQLCEGYWTNFWHLPTLDNVYRVFAFTYTNSLYSLTWENNTSIPDQKKLLELTCVGKPQFLANAAIEFTNSTFYLLSPCPYDTTLFSIFLFNSSIRHQIINVDLSTVSLLQAVPSSPIPPVCGNSCQVHTDCSNSTTCHICRIGRCVSSGKCGDFCMGPQDCYVGDCVGMCNDNQCKGQIY